MGQDDDIWEMLDKLEIEVCKTDSQLSQDERSVEDQSYGKPLGCISSAQDVEKEPGTMFICTDLDDWHSPEADNYKGLCVRRSMDPF